MDRLLVKWETARRLLPRAQIRNEGANAMGVLTVGSGGAACVEALDRLNAQDIRLDYCRVRAFPFGDEVRDFIERHDVVFVVEQNRDAQLRSLLMLDIHADPGKLVSLLHYNGIPLGAGFVVDGVLNNMARGKAA
jgi:2-oxoglutarate ferredoxin oxidoreductase subunit alpha